MRGDFSRIRLSKGKGYTAVLQQQGRVALDADANEQRYLDDSARRTETVDIVGEFGGPAGDEGFAIDASSGDIVIGAGRYYVDGLLCENPAPVSYESQQFLSVPAGTSAALLEQLRSRQTVLQVYLQAWQRLVTALDDPCLREPALGQADTTARLQTVWRVIARPVALDVTKQPGPFCPALYGKSAASSSGTLTVTTSAGTDCGCGPVAAAGYQGIENQLYRVEIQAGGDAGAATFKWSRENGSVVVAVTGVNGATVQVDSLGPDANLGFEVGQWVELTDDTVMFGPVPNLPGTLCQVQSIDKDDLSVTLTAPVTGISPSQNARMRRWDQSGPSASPTGLPLPVAPAVAQLENGIEVSFGAGSYQAGDYWTIPARTATGSVEWPPCGCDGNPAQPPSSLVVHEAPLAVLFWEPDLAAAEPATAEGADDGATGTSESARATLVLPFPIPPLRFGHVAVEDCRVSFRPLTPPAAIHVTSVNWANDDILPIDVLAADGLAVTLDQGIAGPIDGGQFIVTLEAVPSQYGKEAGHAAIRAPYILDSDVTIAGEQIAWQLPAQPTLGYIQSLLTVGTEIGSPARVRVKLAGPAFLAAGAGSGSEPIYLDGRALGAPGTRVDGTTPRVDLRFPSGDGSVASDFESWFYLVPPLSVTGLTIPGNGAYTTVVDAKNEFQGVIPTGSASGVAPVTEVDATTTLSYPAATATSLSVTLAGVTSVTGTLIASAPATVPILRGQDTVTIPITFSGTPAKGTGAVGLTLGAVVLAAADSFQAPAVTAPLTIAAGTPAVAKAAEQPELSPRTLPDPPSPPTVRIPLPPPFSPQPPPASGPPEAPGPPGAPPPATPPPAQ